MTQALLIVGDPLDRLNFGSDSSLAMAQAALELGLSVYWTTPEAIDLLNRDVIVKNPVKIDKVFLDKAPQVSFSNKTLDLAKHFRRVLVRKDPPFDEHYTSLCWLLTQLPAGIVVNSPQALLLNHEKLAPILLARAGTIPEYALVPQLISHSTQSLVEYATELFQTAHSLLKTLENQPEFATYSYKVLCKPWRGHGGLGVQTFSSVEQLSQWLNQLPHNPNTTLLEERIILQPLLPEIFSQGDRRVFIVNGQVLFDFVRRPATGRVEANLAQGGSAELSEMSPLQKELSEKIAVALKQRGVLIAGLDFIGDRITEINITSPTGLRTYESLSGKLISKAVVQGLME
jgi:glutathione synthase